LPLTFQDFAGFEVSWFTFELDGVLLRFFFFVIFGMSCQNKQILTLHALVWTHA
jgi:hypothetical protein